MNDESQNAKPCSEMALHAGMCRLCGMPIYVGDKIQTWHVSGLLTAQHEDCTQNRMEGAEGNQ